MKLKFLAGAGPASYNVVGSMINGINFGEFVEGSAFVGNEQTDAAGIFGAHWEAGELYVTLAQPTSAYQVPSHSHDWTNTGWINAEDYDPDARYVHATNPHAVALLESGQAEYWRDPQTGAWTVRMIDTPEQEPSA